MNNDRSSHLVLGRHTACDVWLGNDPTLSLRHMVASAWLDADGMPQLRILELGGEVQLMLEDGSSSRGFRADGPCLAQVGASTMFLLLNDGRSWPEDPADAWEALGPREVVDLPDNRRDAEFIRTVRPRLRLVGVADGTSLTAARSDRTLLVQLDGPNDLLDLDPDSPGAIGYLGLPGGRFVRLAPADLARGVLIGRYERCELGSTRFSDCPTVSRVHLCLALDPTGLWAIDTCSMNGTWSQGESVRALQLGATAHLLLGRQPLTWQLHQ